MNSFAGTLLGMRNSDAILIQLSLGNALAFKDPYKLITDLCGWFLFVNLSKRIIILWAALKTS